MASHQQLPTKAAPAPRKAPPHVPADRQPEVGIHVAVQQFVTVLRAGRRGGWRAWEFVAVMAMVPPANMPPAQQVADHMSALFPSRATTAVPQAAAVPAQSPPPKAYPRRPAIDVGRPSAVAAAGWGDDHGGVGGHASLGDNVSGHRPRPPHRRGPGVFISGGGHGGPALLQLGGTWRRSGRWHLEPATQEAPRGHHRQRRGQAPSGRSRRGRRTQGLSHRRALRRRRRLSMRPRRFCSAWRT